jgi:excisionase family DNA binding protein
MDNEIPNDLLTVKAAAQIFGVHEKTIRNWLTAKKIKKYRKMRLVFVSQAEIEQQTAIKTEP